jgi:ribosome-binding ATPase
MESVDKRRERAQKNSKAGGKIGEEAKAELALCDRVKADLDRGIPVRAQKLSEEERAAIADLFLLTAKPVLYVANISEGQLADAEADRFVREVVEIARSEDAEYVVLAAAIEAEIQQLPPSDRKGFLESVGLTEPGLDKVVRAGYRLLGLQTYFTVGPEECRAWTFHRGWRAPQAAGVIHTDFERGFIKAEVMRWEDLIRYGSESAVKDRGLLRVEGKEYVVQDGDCMHFRFNV